MLNLVRSYLDKKILLVYIHQTQHEDSRSLRMILSHKETTNFIVIILLFRTNIVFLMVCLITAMTMILFKSMFQWDSCLHSLCLNLKVAVKNKSLFLSILYCKNSQKTYCNGLHLMLGFLWKRKVKLRNNKNRRERHRKKNKKKLRCQLILIGILWKIKTKNMNKWKEFTN